MMMQHIREVYAMLYATWVYNFDRWAWKRRWRKIRKAYQEFPENFERWYTTGNWHREKG